MVTEMILEASSVIDNTSFLACDLGSGYGMMMVWYGMMIGKSVAGHVIRVEGCWWGRLLFI